MKKTYIYSALGLVAIGALALFLLMPHSEATDKASGSNAATPISADAIAAASPGDLWSVRCGEGTDAKKPQKGKCEIYQRLAIKETGKRLMEFAVGFPEGKDEARGIFILPLGMLLEQGAQMQIDDGKPFTFRPRYCDPGGCVAYLDLKKDVLDSISKGKQMTITIINPEKKTLQVPMPLKGFAEALGKVS